QSSFAGEAIHAILARWRCLSGRSGDCNRPSGPRAVTNEPTAAFAFLGLDVLVDRGQIMVEALGMRLAHPSDFSDNRIIPHISHPRLIRQYLAEHRPEASARERSPIPCAAAPAAAELRERTRVLLLQPARRQRQ